MTNYGLREGMRFAHAFIVATARRREGMRHMPHRFGSCDILFADAHIAQDDKVWCVSLAQDDKARERRKRTMEDERYGGR
jgi:hypothetical protein